MHRCTGCSLYEAAELFDISTDTATAWEASSWWRNACEEAVTEIQKMVRETKDRALLDAAQAALSARKEVGMPGPHQFHCKVRNRWTREDYRELLAGRTPRNLIRQLDSGIV